MALNTMAHWDQASLLGFLLQYPAKLKTGVSPTYFIRAVARSPILRHSYHAPVPSYWAPPICNCVKAGCHNENIALRIKF